MYNYIKLTLENHITIYSQHIRLNNNFDFSLINLLNTEYIKYLKNYPNLFICIQIKFNNVNYSYPLINKLCEISEKLKKTNAVIVLDICSIEKLDSMFHNIFLNFSDQKIYFLYCNLKFIKN